MLLLPIELVMRMQWLLWGTALTPEHVNRLRKLTKKNCSNL